MTPKKIKSRNGKVAFLEKGFGELAEKIENLKREVEKQEARGSSITIGVLIAFVFTVGIVAIEVILFHSK